MAHPCPPASAVSPIVQQMSFAIINGLATICFRILCIGIGISFDRFVNDFKCYVDNKLAAFSRRSFNADTVSHHINDAFGDRHAEAGVLYAADGGCTLPFKGFNTFATNSSLMPIPLSFTRNSYAPRLPSVRVCLSTTEMVPPSGVNL